MSRPRSFLKMQVPLEGDHQKTFIQWVDRYGIARWPVLRFRFSIPNGSSYVTGKRYQEAARQKALGLRKGMPDFCLPYPAGSYHGLFIEFKRSVKSAVSPEQTEVMDYLASVGYAVTICYDAEQAVDVVTKYLRGELML